MNRFHLPDLGEGLAEAEIVRWHINIGDRVSADQPMLAVETEKAIVEVPCPCSGIVKALHGTPGDLIQTGALLVEFESDVGDPVAGPGRVAPHPADAGTVVGRMPAVDDDFPSPPVPDAPDRVRAVPAARALAKRLGIDLSGIRGSGRGAVITIDDVLNVSALTPEKGVSAPPSAPLSGKAAATPATPPISAGGEELRGPRRAMAQSMALARDEVMGCTVFDDADLCEWPEGQDITVRVLRAVAAACVAEPALNAWFDGATRLRRVFTHVDVAIAVDTQAGLIVPVARDVGSKSVAELRRDLDRLKQNARERAVAPEDLRHFTFMLSNFGMIAGRYGTPVVVPPAVAILGTGRISRDVVAVDGGIESHPRMPLSLTFDHRCVTGGEAARFMAALIRDLQKGS